jgi:hypothetical protein
VWLRSTRNATGRGRRSTRDRCENRDSRRLVASSRHAAGVPFGDNTPGRRRTTTTSSPNSLSGERPTRIDTLACFCERSGGGRYEISRRQPYRRPVRSSELDEPQ